MRRIKKLSSKKRNRDEEFETALDLVEGPAANAVYDVQSNSVIANDFEQHIDIICRKYGISYFDNGNGTDKLSLIPIKDLFKSDIKICGGNNRHEALLRIMVSPLIRNRSILSSDVIRNLAMEWNGEHCLPPLDELEFNEQWKCALRFVAKHAKQSNNNDNNVDINNSNQEEKKNKKKKKKNEDKDDGQEEENILEKA